MTISSVSGAHPFNASHLVDALIAYIAEEDKGEETPWDEATYREEAIELATPMIIAMDEGVCPRCHGPYLEHEIPSGSRETQCRCIPICMTCAEAEARVQIALAFHESTDHHLCVGLPEWGETTQEDQRASLDALEVTQFEQGKVTWAEVPAGELHVMPTSGWGLYGYDDSKDQEDRGS